MNSIRKHITSYQHAMRGIWFAFRYEPNMIVHLVAAVAVLVMNSVLNVNKTEWLITVMLIGIAWMSEVFNTAIEKLADRVSSDRDPLIATAKDLAAGAVLVISIVATICALVIYLPYLSAL